MIPKLAKPKWFNIKKSQLIINSDDQSFYKIPFIKNDNNIKTAIYKTDNKPLIKYKPNESFNYYSAAYKLIDNYHQDLLKLKNHKMKESKIKELITKLNKAACNLNTVIRVTKKYRLQLDNKQKNIIQNWIIECRNLYNKCVDKHNTNNKYFNKGYKAIKSSLFNEIYGETKKPVPYDVLTDEVRAFCSNLNGSYTNKKNGNITHFTMKHKSAKNKSYSLLIPYKSINKNGFFITLLGVINKLELNELPIHDCRLYYDHKFDTYTLSIPTDVKCKTIANREDIVAIDPGEKNFIYFHGLTSYGYIGKDIRIQLLQLRNKISRLQKILSNNKNRNKKKLRNKKHLNKKINKYYKKIKNIVKELHNQSANYLCKNYDKILIPKFETQKMISHKKSSYKEYKKDYINEGQTAEDKKQRARELTKKTRLNKNVKFVLNSLSHYKFREHLTEKAAEYGCELKVVTEEYTSCTCCQCGHMSKKYKDRIKKCENCRYKIDRDLNGSRNILIKNLSVFNYEAIKPMVTCKP